MVRNDKYWGCLQGKRGGWRTLARFWFRKNMATVPGFLSPVFTVGRHTEQHQHRRRALFTRTAHATRPERVPLTLSFDVQSGRPQLHIRRTPLWQYRRAEPISEV